jgi:hypothetical protein
VPSYDLKALYVTNDVGNSLTEVDPRSGKAGPTIPVEDPYNAGPHGRCVWPQPGRYSLTFM